MSRRIRKVNIGAVAVFDTNKIKGDVIVTNCKKGVDIIATFTKLPPGKHGFHIHKAGDLRGEGCHGLCEHYDVGKNIHGDGPHSKKERHTGDLGNIQIKKGRNTVKRKFCIKDTSVKELWGRSIIVHEDEDDLGKGHFKDSKITGHSGARIGCALFGRMSCSPVISRKQTRKKSK
jgi:Cu-Zn family superoxide dismutase